MRRATLAVAVLMIAASPTLAGYIIVRVVLEGGSASSGGGMMGGPGGMDPPGTSLGPTPGGRGMPGSSQGPPPGSGGMSDGEMPGYGATSGVKGPADPARSVVVVIPYENDKLVREQLNKKYGWHPTENPGYYKFPVYHYGQKLQTALFVDSTTIQLYQDLIAVPGARKTRGTEINEKYEQWARGKTNVQALYDALILALQSGVIRDQRPTRDGGPPHDASHIAQELLDVAAAKKLTLPAEVQRFVKAWEPIHKAVKGSDTESPEAQNWKFRLDARSVRVEGHYAVISWDSQESEVSRRSRQLNDNFIAFYLWHATRGVSLPVPPKPLVVVLGDQGQRMHQLRRGLDGLPMQTDAFFAPDHNLLVLSPEPLDSVGQTFLRQNQQIFAKGFNRNTLLTGQIPQIDSTGQKGSMPDDVARAMTLATVEKLLLEESEVAAVSREGTQQLLFASGVLPRHVRLPNWLTNGALNTFTRPRGPAYTTQGDEDKPFMTVALTTGYGVPNYVLQRYFRDFDTHKELGDSPAKLLENVLTDAYFLGIKNGDDPDPIKRQPKKKKTTTAGGPQPPGGLGGLIGGALTGDDPDARGGGQQVTTYTEEEDPAVALRKKRERLTNKAQATAWALYYYLAWAKPDELKAYLAELDKLPRDLPIDGRTALATFVRVFDLAAADGTPDPTDMEKFANDWLGYVRTLPRAGFDLPVQMPEPKKADPNMGMGGMPFAPGGSPGP